MIVNGTEQLLATRAEKPLKRLASLLVIPHRAEAAVLMRARPRTAEPRFNVLTLRRFNGSLIAAWSLMKVFFFAAAVTAFGAESDVRRDAAVIATEQVIPSVVNIATETVIEYHEWYDDLLRQFYGWPNTPVRQIGRAHV